MRWHSHSQLFRSAAVALSAMLLLAQTATACPFCFGSQQLTLREQIETPDAAMLVEWVQGEPGNINTDVPATTTFRILQIWQGDYQPEDSLTIERYQDGQAGEQFLITGNLLDDVIRWDRSIRLSAAGLNYVRSLPPSTATVTERLRHAIAHLESADMTIANDAFDVVAAAKYEDLAAAREHLSVEHLRVWVHDPETSVSRLGVYGMLLGLAGDAQDIPSLRQKIFVLDPDRPIRLGIDGVMGGYLLLTGAKGLAELDEAFLKPPDVTADNLAAVTSALRFLWEYGDERIAHERLCQSMRLALNHEATKELAIIDLARWQDWAITGQLVELYNDETTDDYLKRKIIGFLTVASQAPTHGLTEAEITAVKLATTTLESIRTTDQELYRNARRGLILR